MALAHMFAGWDVFYHGCCTISQRQIHYVDDVSIDGPSMDRDLSGVWTAHRSLVTSCFLFSRTSRPQFSGGPRLHLSFAPDISIMPLLARLDGITFVHLPFFLRSAGSKDAILPWLLGRAVRASSKVVVESCLFLRRWRC